jgi:uncharacterized protein
MERFSLFIRENIRLLVGLAVVIFFSILLASFIASDRNQDAQVSINNAKFGVVLAKTNTEKEIGLSNTRNLPQNRGMLFLFDQPAYYAFWMKEMKFPIDIIFIRGNKVTTVFSNVLPPSQTNGQLPLYQPKDASEKVLELNAGMAQKYNIQEGSVVEINNL